MQKSFADQEYAAKRKTTRRERFLKELARITLWSDLLSALAPFYPKGEGRARPPIGLERMLRMYIVQHSLGLSDEGIEDVLYDSKGLVLHKGTIVDSTIIAAPSSTKNQKGERDPEMHQVKKGDQWHFGMKAHIGVDADSGLVHTVVGMAANVNDGTEAQALLHGDEKEGFGDAGYQGAEQQPEAQGKVGWNIALRPGKRRALEKGQEIDRLCNQLKTIKARIRAKVEHPFHIIKNRFGSKKTRCRGLDRNTMQPMTLFGLANLVVAKRRLLAFSAQGAS
jgi:transposase, IS5 family